MIWKKNDSKYRGVYDRSFNVDIIKSKTKDYLVWRFYNEEAMLTGVENHINQISIMLFIAMHMIGIYRTSY